jgi:hypothetical protein
VGRSTAAILSAIALAIVAIAGVTPVGAQGTGAKIHGHVNNPAGQALKAGDVKLTTDKTSASKDRVYKYSFPLDANGDYKGADILPGDYVVTVFADGKSLDFQDVPLKVGDDKTVDFDMSRAEYLKLMTPEERAALEEYKKKNAAVSADNAKIENLNKAMKEAQEDEAAGKGDEAVKLLEGMPALRPTEPIIWAALGQAQLSAGDQAAKAAGLKPPYTDQAVLDKYAAAAASFQKAIDNAPTNKKITPDIVAAYYLNLGQALSKGGKLTEAAAAYETSATTFPGKAGTAYYNESVIMYTANKNAEANAAADKAIAADPKRADAYYIKAQALIPGAAPDPKTGKFVLPPGCLEAYQEYLELAPEGPHAAEVKDLLTNLGQPVKNSFKAGKK